MTITDKKLIDALRRMAPETGSLICFGCGYERGCPVHGCAVLKAAVGRLEELTAPPSNAPLTLEQLREMDGEPVWVVALDYGTSRWAFVSADCEVVRYFTTRRGVACDVIGRHFKTYGKTWLAYRRRPEEGGER